MRESIGGAWLFGIVVTFIVLFSSFLAYSVSYTKAFNVKNMIIDYIETSEGYTSYTASSDIYNANLSNDPTVEGKSFNLIKNVGYNYSLTQNIVCEKGYNKPGGYCLVKVCPDGSSVSNVHYKVTTYIALEIPIVSVVVKIPISGETRSIYHDNTGYACTP